MKWPLSRNEHKWQHHLIRYCYQPLTTQENKGVRRENPSILLGRGNGCTQEGSSRGQPPSDLPDLSSLAQEKALVLFELWDGTGGGGSLLPCLCPSQFLSLSPLRPISSSLLISSWQSQIVSLTGMYSVESVSNKTDLVWCSTWVSPVHVQFQGLCLKWASTRKDR